MCFRRDKQEKKSNISDSLINQILSHSLFKLKSTPIFELVGAWEKLTSYMPWICLCMTAFAYSGTCWLFNVTPSTLFVKCGCFPACSSLRNGCSPACYGYMCDCYSVCACFGWFSVSCSKVGWCTACSPLGSSTATPTSPRSCLCCNRWWGGFWLGGRLKWRPFSTRQF